MDIFTILANHKVLPHEELLRLLEIAQGDTPQAIRARHKIINHNLRLVVAIAKKYQKKSIPIEDLIHEGIFGLNKAIDRFDRKVGTRFSTYATHWIRQSVLRSTQDKSSLVRIPVHVQEKLFKIKTKAREFHQKYQRNPSLEELSSLVNIPCKDILFYCGANCTFTRVLSVNTLTEDGSREYLEMLGENDPFSERIEDEDIVQVALNSLSMREQHFVKLRCFEDLSISDACSIAGISNPQIANRRIIKKMRKAIRH